VLGHRAALELAVGGGEAVDVAYKIVKFGRMHATSKYIRMNKRRGRA
jgi:hypothetical protein